MSVRPELKRVATEIDEMTNSFHDIWALCIKDVSCLRRHDEATAPFKLYFELSWMPSWHARMIQKLSGLVEVGCTTMMRSG